MRPVEILCEGACSGPIAAYDREAALIKTIRAGDAGTRAEAEREIRSHVTRSLTYTPHIRCGIGRRGQEMFSCTICEHERAFGRTAWEASPYA